MGGWLAPPAYLIKELEDTFNYRFKNKNSGPSLSTYNHKFVINLQQKYFNFDGYKKTHLLIIHLK